MNKTNSTHRYRTPRLATLLIACLFANPAFAANYYNYGVDGSRITNAAEYSNIDGTTENATVNPGASDNLFFFNSTAGAGPLDRRLEVGTAQLDFNSMTFRSNAGAIQFDRGGAPGTATATVVRIGTGGITLDAGAGPVTFGRLAASGNDQRVIVGAIADFTINNDSASDLTFVRGFDGRLNNTTNVVTVAGSGSGNTVFASGIQANSTGRDLAIVVNTTGSGAVVIDGTSTYTGATTVSAGSLIINGDQSAANGVLTVSAGAILGGSGTIGGATTISGSLRPGNSIGTLTVANNVTWNGGENWIFELGGAGPSILSPGTSDLLAITGNNDFLKGTGASFTFDFAGSATTEGWYKLVDWTGGSTTFDDVLAFSGVNLGGGFNSEFSIQEDALYVNVVPEPSTYALLALAVGALGAHVIRRRRST
jgi:fibronectin-binding autotransporter adhesin